jgi:hypothetical protein
MESQVRKCIGLLKVKYYIHQDKLHEWQQVIFKIWSRCVRFEVLVTININIMVFWHVVLSCLTDICQCCREVCCHHRSYMVSHPRRAQPSWNRSAYNYTAAYDRQVKGL